jgi:hypothetical protein
LLFPDLLPELSEREWADLRESIRRNGVITPIIVDEGYGVIDGAHRVTIAAELGLTVVPVEVRPGLTPAQKMELAYSLNEDRRQMDAETIRRLKAARVERVAASRRKGKSIRTIAEEEGVSKSQVERDLQAAKSTVPGGTVEPPKGKVRGKDGKARSATRNPKPRKRRVAQRPAAGAPAEPATPTSPGTSSDGEGSLDDLWAQINSLRCEQDALAAASFVAASLLGEQGEHWRAVLRMMVTASGESLAKFKAALEQDTAARKSSLDAATIALEELGEGASDQEVKQRATTRWPGAKLRQKDVDRARARLKRRQADPAPAAGGS